MNNDNESIDLVAMLVIMMRTINKMTRLMPITTKENENCRKSHDNKPLAMLSTMVHYCHDATTIMHHFFSGRFRPEFPKCHDWATRAARFILGTQCCWGPPTRAQHPRRGQP